MLWTNVRRCCERVNLLKEWQAFQELAKRFAEGEVRRGKWGDAIKNLERVLLEFAPGDSRIPQARYWLGEAKFAIGNHLEAAREFRRVSDETPNDRLAPDALLRVGDVYADLWRRPERFV